MGEIKMYRWDGSVSAVTLVDDEDEARFGHLRWCYTPRGYVTRSAGGRKNQWTMWLHREILGLERGDPMMGDHINGDTLDNRRSNLRIVTAAQNQQNRRGAQRTSTSQYRGVSWDATRKMWATRVCINGKMHNLGRFADELEAARAVSEFRAAHMPFSSDARAA